MKKTVTGFLFLLTFFFAGVAMSKSVSVQEPKSLTIDPKKHYEAVISTSKGDIHVSLNAEKAPWSVNNFVYLAKSGYYEGLTFHRVEPGFVIQGGDPSGDGTGGPGYTVKAEIGLPHTKGALAWARTGDTINPERRSSGSQFYITLEATPFLDSGYTVFGQTTGGMDVVEKIQKGDKILKVTVTEK
jgi:peptidyl-prolyl cis-trans isomerase B (cyclophilin B)